MALSRMIRAHLFALVALSGSGALEAHPQSAAGASPEERAAGAQIFQVQCAGCHGLDGSGSANGSNLTTGSFRYGSSDEALGRTITKGIPGTTMVGSRLEERQLRQLIAHLRSLSAARPPEPTRGEPAKGALLMETHGCLRCHTVESAGASLGPNLAGIGSRRQPAQLERSVLDPNEEVSSDYWSIRVRTKAGQTITAMRLNEDTYSYQVLDGDGRLRSLLKEELAEHEMVRTSPMPSFKGKLQPAELQDLIAYLASLRGGAPTRGPR